MNNFATRLKDDLWDMISSMAENAWLYVTNPKSNFTRNRKLSFENMMKLVITMGGATVNEELLEFFQYSPDTATGSAFNQQRSHIKYEAFEQLFHEFSAKYPGKSTHKGYRVLACDGSNVVYATNPNNKEDFVTYKTRDTCGYNQLHLNALYDVCNHTFVDALIQPGVQCDERDALYTFMNRYQMKTPYDTIITVDRGYESYNAIATAEHKQFRYVFRAKDFSSSNSLLSSFMNEKPDSEEFDIRIRRFLTRRRGKTIESQPIVYHRIHPRKRFDFLEPDSTKLHYMDFRVVRFKISNDTYECIITNLPEWEFDMKDIKNLYNMRWGIETSFRTLKYSVGMTNFHAKKVEYIKQEIFAKLILFNFSNIIASHAVIEKRKQQKQDAKYVYQLNYHMAIRICHKFIAHCSNDTPPPDVLALLSRYLLPIKPGRQFKRNLRGIGAASFVYRIT